MVITGNITLVINVKEDVRPYEKAIVAAIRHNMTLPEDLADLFDVRVMTRLSDKQTVAVLEWA